MCRTQGRRCPSCTNTAGRDKHNTRRRTNRAIQRQIANWANANGEPPDITRLLQQAPPSIAKQWAANHHAQITTGTETPRPSPVTAEQNQPASTTGTVQSWLTPTLIDQIRAAITTQGWSPDERDLLTGDPTTITQNLEGSNDTYAVTLTTGITGFHKTFAGANTNIARAYQQDGYQQPLHEVAAWRIAATLGAPWVEIVASSPVPKGSSNLVGRPPSAKRARRRSPPAAAREPGGR